MVIPLHLSLLNDTGLLEEVVDNSAAANFIAVEIDLHPLAEAGRVVVSEGFGVSEGFEDGVGIHDLVSYGFGVFLVGLSCHGCEVSEGCGEGGGAAGGGKQKQAKMSKSWIIKTEG